MSVPGKSIRGGSYGALALLTLQDVEADAAELVDIGVVDLGEEANLWGDHRIVVC